MKVIVLSGVSGSGKSTWIKENHPSAYVVSADHYFLTTGGEYRFDASKLSAAHGACFREFIVATQNSTEESFPIVVDNTNTTDVEISPYMLVAQAYCLPSEIVTLMPRRGRDVGWVDLTKCAERNKHGVSLQAIEAQDARIQARNLPPWWTETRVPMK